MTNYDWGDALNDLKIKEGIKNDAALAKSLGITRAFICAIRKGKKNIPKSMCREILFRLGDKQSRYNQLDGILDDKIVIRSNAPNFIARMAAMKRANGFCERCNMPAPFLLSNGTPYLEAHHILPLSEVREEDPKNIVMLCPNCHSRIEVLKNESDLDELRKCVNRDNSSDDKIVNS